MITFHFHNYWKTFGKVETEFYLFSASQHKTFSTYILSIIVLNFEFCIYSTRNI